MQCMPRNLTAVSFDVMGGCCWPNKTLYLPTVEGGFGINFTGELGNPGHICGEAVIVSTFGRLSCPILTLPLWRARIFYSHYGTAWLVDMSNACRFVQW